MAQINRYKILFITTTVQEILLIVNSHYIYNFYIQNVSRAVIDVPNDAIASGNFDKNDEFMKLTWKSAGIGNNYVIVSFKRDDKTYILSGIEVSIEPENLPGLSMYFYYNKHLYIEFIELNITQYFNFRLDNETCT